MKLLRLLSCWKRGGWALLKRIAATRAAPPWRRDLPWEQWPRSNRRSWRVNSARFISLLAEKPVFRYGASALVVGVALLLLPHSWMQWLWAIPVCPLTLKTTGVPFTWPRLDPKATDQVTLITQLNLQLAQLQAAWAEQVTTVGPEVNSIRGRMQQDEQFLGTRTISAGNYPRGTTGVVGNDNAVAVNAAIAAAPGLGALYVSVPVSLLPYNASLVSFNVNVTMIREGGNPSTFDVQAYGANPDGVTDSIAAFNAAIAGCIGQGDPTTTARTPNGALFFPGSRAVGNAIASYALSTELLIRSVQGLKVYGDGTLAVVLVFTSNLTNGFNLDGVAYSTFEGFSVTTKPGFTVTNLINCHWGAGTFRSVTGNTFRNLFIGLNAAPGNALYVNGIALGTDNSLQVDGCSFERVFVQGGWTAGNVTSYQRGIVMGNGTFANNLDHCFYNCEVTSNAIGMYFNGSNGSVFGGQQENNSRDFQFDNDAGQIHISGVRSEGATSFFVQGIGPSGASQALSIDSCVFYGNALTAAQTYSLIVFQGAGPYCIRNFRFATISNAAAVATVDVNPLNVAMILVDGFTVANSQTIAQTFTNVGGQVAMFDIRGFQSIDAASAQVAYVPYRFYNPTVNSVLTSGAIFTSLATGIITPTETVLVSGIDARAGNALTVTLTAARLVGAPLNPTTGQRMTFTFIQDGTGGRNVTWNAVFKVSWIDTGNTASKRSSIAFIYDGTNWNQDGAQTPYV